MVQSLQKTGLPMTGRLLFDSQSGYALWDAGYDVWLGNSRGNYYSRKHVNMTKSDPKFWNFSWHDMGVHDIPAVIDYILDHTGHKDLFFIGHSMGCAMFFVGMAAKPRYNDKIRVMFGLGPASYMHNGKRKMELVSEGLYDGSKRVCVELLDRALVHCDGNTSAVRPDVSGVVSK
uniref:AB hydrolase-1 domain-containing protein n=1 Tax=Timema cristinae TaxID=61476 RepID=A0A7R9CSA5_TIMCR|nr:unnamed protein product [Timema cristinae]